MRQLGYGDFSASFHPTLALFTNFESRLAEFRRNIQTGFVDGTEVVTRRVRELIGDYAARKTP